MWHYFIIIIIILHVHVRGRGKIRINNFHLIRRGPSQLTFYCDIVRFELIARAMRKILYYNFILKFKYIIHHYKLKRHIKIYITYLNKKN